MANDIDSKIDEIKKTFNSLDGPEKKYEKIMALGRESPKLDRKHKTEDNLVPGCQSVMYLHSFTKDGKIFFEAESDALISSGLAALLIKVYSGEPPETILMRAPDFLEELGIDASLTPSRANGLYSIHLKMKQEALKALTKK